MIIKYISCFILLFLSNYSFAHPKDCSLNALVSKAILEDSASTLRKKNLYHRNIIQQKINTNFLKLSGITVTNQDFSEMSFRGTNFDKSHLINVNLEDTDLTDTTFKEAVFEDI